MSAKACRSMSKFGMFTRAASPAPAWTRVSKSPHVNGPSEADELPGAAAAEFKRSMKSRACVQSRPWPDTESARFSQETAWSGSNGDSPVRLPSGPNNRAVQESAASFVAAESPATSR